MTRVHRRWIAFAAPLLALAAALPLFAMNGAAAMAPLQSFESCDALADHYRGQTLRAYSGHDSEDLEPQEEAEQAAGEAFVPAAPADQGATSETGTNVQVLGVDESDIVKTDGAYIYLLRPQRLLVARIVEGASVEFAGELAFAGRCGAQQLLIAGGKQLALRQLNSNDSYSVRGRAELLEIDISEPARPQLLRELDPDGWILSARLVGSRARVVLRHHASPQLRYRSRWHFPGEQDPGAAADRYNTRLIENAWLGHWQPLYALDDRRTGSWRFGYALDCTRTYSPAEPRGALEMTYLLSFELAAGIAEWGSAGLVAARDYSQHQSRIHRFDISDPLEPVYFGSGAVPGILLSQWSLDEHNGYLRAASTRCDRSPKSAGWASPRKSSPSA